MFCSTDLAARIERSEGRLTESIGRHLVRAKPQSDVLVRHLGGGIAVFAGPLSPMNKMIGLGFHHPPTDDQLTAVEREFATRDAALQAEISTLADPGLSARLSRRGYFVQGFENVLGRRVDAGDDGSPPAAPASAAVTVAQMSPDDQDAWLDVAVTSFLAADTEGVPAEPLPPREDLEQSVADVMHVPGFTRYSAWIDGHMVGVATMRLDDRVAQLCGAATLPSWRRRGVQTALLHRRLADAARAGCDVAVMTTAPGTKSQENGLRQGFALLYSRVLLVKPAPVNRSTVPAD
jgi:hypothetical protein